jgi:phage shock protein E
MQSISVLELKDRLEKDPSLLLIDVRTKTEFVQGHVPSAVNIPLHEIQENPEQTIPFIQKITEKKDVFYIICLSDGRSKIATFRLADYNIINGCFVVGGTNSWVFHGFPTEIGQGHPCQI